MRQDTVETQMIHVKSADWHWVGRVRESAPMSSPNLQLTLSDERSTLTPLPGHIVSACTADPACRHRATHRVLSRSPVHVELLCDDHTLVWAAERGLNITTARPPYAAGAESLS